MIRPQDEPITEEPREPVAPENDPAADPESGNEKEAEVHEYIDRLKRLQAEFENYKKRMIREMKSVDDRVADRELLAMLPLYDNLQRAFANFASDGDKGSLISGVEQIFAQFRQILEEKGIQQIPALGTSFDPAVHEALLGVASDQEKNTILEEFSPGYTRNGRTLRPSKVAVSQGPALIEEEDE